MHVIVDTDYFMPTPSDTFDILSGDTNPRVEFTGESEDESEKIIERHGALIAEPVPFEKLLVANYLFHGLDYCSKGSKRKMKDAWPTQLEDHEQASDVGLVLPVSPRAAKSIIRLSQSLDQIALEKGASPEVVQSSQGRFNSMMQAYKLVSAYSGVLNEADVREKFGGDHYKAIDTVITSTQGEFARQKENIAAGLEMVGEGRKDKKVLGRFNGRWRFMKDTLEGLLEKRESD